MKIKELIDMWNQDCVIDTNDPDMSLSVPKLHSKYLNLLIVSRIQLKKMMAARQELEEKLHGYYSGVIDGRDIGRDPFQLEVGTKSLIEKRVTNDAEMIKMNLDISVFEEKVLFIKEVLESIKFRNNTIKNHIEWTKWKAGEL